MKGGTYQVDPTHPVLVLRVLELLLVFCAEKVRKGWEGESLTRLLKRLVSPTHQHAVRRGGLNCVLHFVEAMRPDILASSIAHSTGDESEAPMPRELLDQVWNLVDSALDPSSYDLGAGPSANKLSHLRQY